MQQLLRKKPTLCVKVVDATNFEGSHLPLVQALVKSTPVVLAVTKCDLMPRMTAGDLEYLQRRVERKWRLSYLRLKSHERPLWMEIIRRKLISILGIHQ